MDRILIVLLNIFRQISKCKRGDLVPCGRHPCLLIKREEMMINSEKLKLLPDYYCCDRKFRAACEQSFAPWQQATIEIMFAISLTISCSRFIYYGVILHAHPVRGESHKQRNTTGEVATSQKLTMVATFLTCAVTVLWPLRKNDWENACSCLSCSLRRVKYETGLLIAWTVL